MDGGPGCAARSATRRSALVRVVPSGWICTKLSAVSRSQTATSACAIAAMRWSIARRRSGGTRVWATTRTARIRVCMLAPMLWFPLWQPTADVLRIALVRFAELTAQRRLLVQDHEDIYDREERHPIDEQRHRPREQRLAEQDGADAEVHRIAHVSVQPLHDQLPGGIDGRKCATTAARKLPDAREQERGARRDEQQRQHHAWIGEIDLRVRHAEVAPRDVPRDHAGEQDRPEQAAEREPKTHAARGAWCPVPSRYATNSTTSSPST